MTEKNKLPEVVIFAGPNGSGKTTITRMAKTVGVYINAYAFGFLLSLRTTTSITKK